MKNLAKAIVAVMKEVKGMEKNSTVGSGNYAYSGTKDQDVKEVFNDALAKNGLCILPIGVESKTQVDRWEETYNGNTKQKQSVFTEVETKYLLLHDSGESVELAGYGHGVDNQDKGAGKATTYALKNCLLYAFLTPVGKIDDTDTTHSEEIKTPPAAKPKLTTAQFEAALKGTKNQIQTVLNQFSMTKSQKETLKKLSTNV
jgi:hypothetical protein